MTDTELLQDYVQNGSQAAFAQLVQLHVDAVYSAARRQVRRDDALAEEITQQVFVLLAQKASTIKPEVIIGGWLYNAVGFVARDELRKVERRTHHETKAAAMADEMRKASEQTAKSDPWNDAELVLDDAMGELDEQTRGLLVLRFFEGRSLGEVGQRMGITEEAARKRLSRAMDRLRDLFQQRGVVMSVTALAEALAVKSVIHAPAYLAVSATSAASAASTASIASTGIVKTGLTLMAVTKSHLVVVSVVGVMALGTVVVGGKLVATSFLATKTPTRTITLPSSATIAGVVRDPLGKPLAGAELLVCAQGKSINIYDPPTRGVAIPTTGVDGAFTILKPALRFELIVRSPQGYAQVSDQTLAKSTDVRIEPWGSVEGRVLAGTTPLAKVAIHMFETPAPYGFTTVMRQAQVRTDADGRFIFPRVAPGEIRLAQQDPVTQRFYRWTYAVVDAGKKAAITIGGTGRPIIGRFANPSTTQPLVWDFTWPSGKFNPSTSFRQTNGPAFRRPEHQSGETLEEYRATEEAFGRTPEGAEINCSVFGGWQFRVNADGTFRIDDVPAGEYALDAGIMQMEFAEVIAQAATTVRVEPMPGDRSDEPLDIGSVPMKAVAHLHPGDAVTPFDITMLDGSIKNITDFGGNHLLLVFFSTAEGYKEGVEAFKRLAADYEGDSRMQMLWLSISTPEEAAACAERYGLSGMIASVASTDLPSEYDALQANGVLIDPAGKLVQKRMTPEVAKKFVRQSLGPPEVPAK